MREPSRAPLLAAVVGGIAALVVLTIAVSDQTFLVGETAVLQEVNGLPGVVGWPLRQVMQLGTLSAGLLVLAAMAILARTHGLVPVGAAVLGVAAAARLDNAWKAVVERPRPAGLVDGLHVRDRIGGFGFPSGHTTMAFALAALVHPVLPRAWRPLPWVIAACVGFGRMYVGVHWPADVVGGAALGTAIGTGAWLVALTVARRGGGSVAARDTVA